MAFSMGNDSRGRRRSVGTMSEINIVPLVDVVLVLLIIFMLTAQVMEFGLEIDVPKVRQTAANAQERPVLSLTAKGNLYLNEAAININDVKAEVERRFGKDIKDVYVRADRNVTWDVLAQVVSAIKEAQLRAQLVTKAEDIPDRRR
ncbi:MAG: biopolymer transporter ExbD [Bryobacterales bacterium]|nr:biopolymer transporter ExbD [Bryobacterales bacterium]